MNIGIDIRSIMYGNYTGIGEYTFQLLNHVFTLDRENRYVLFCNSKKQTKLPSWPSDKVSIDQFHYSNKLLHASMLAFGRPRLQSMVEGRQDLVLDRIFLPNQNFFRPRSNDHLTITVHDLSFVRFPNFFTPMHRVWHKAVGLRKLVEKADQVIAVSEHTSRDLQTLWKVPASKIHVSHPGLDPIFFEALNNDEQVKAKYNLPKQYLLFLGTLEPRKNCEAVIKAFDHLAKSHPELHLVLAGGWGWETAGIKKALADSKFSDRIRLLGYVDRTDKPALYRNAAVFCYPSFYEGFGFPVLEAMSQGCPVVTSTTSSLPEVTGNNALCVPPHDLSALADAIDSVLREPAHYRSMVESAQTRARSFTWEDTAKKFINLVSRV
jgi:glycosyltransferase involved in cell wall biosynthesis